MDKSPVYCRANLNSQSPVHLSCMSLDGRKLTRTVQRHKENKRKAQERVQIPKKINKRLEARGSYNTHTGFQQKVSRNHFTAFGLIEKHSVNVLFDLRCDFCTLNLHL